MADPPAGPQKGDIPVSPTSTVRFTSTTSSNLRDSHNASSNLPSDNRPKAPERTATDATDASDDLPPHFRSSIVDIPVTPGIGLTTYKSAESSRDNTINSKAEKGEPSYFSALPPNDSVVASPNPVDDNMAGVTPDAEGPASGSGQDILRRMSKSSRGRRESIDDIRSAYPSLALSGNVISATFNMPHSLKYRKGADWVSANDGFERPIFTQLPPDPDTNTIVAHRNSSHAADNPRFSIP